MAWAVSVVELSVWLEVADVDVCAGGRVGGGVLGEGFAGIDVLLGVTTGLVAAAVGCGAAGVARGTGELALVRVGVLVGDGV